MRLLRVNFPDNTDHLELHPKITVISELAENSKDYLLDVVEAISEKNTHSVFALVELAGQISTADSPYVTKLWEKFESQKVFFYHNGESNDSLLGSLCEIKESSDSELTAPVVISSTFETYNDEDINSFLDQLQDLSRSVQVLLVSKSVTVQKWCENVGDANAMFIVEKSNQKV